MSRMWMVPTEIMCNQHLIGCHKEIHQLVGSLRKKHSIDGYIRNNCVEPLSVITRHNAIVEEMIKRGMNHFSPIIDNNELTTLLEYLPKEQVNYRVDVEASLKDITTRCGMCHNLAFEYGKIG